MKVFICLILSVLFHSALHGQSHEVDTIVKEKHFTYVDYYPKGKIKVLGNYQDTIKTGNWIYFDKKGRVLAFGKYKSNRKFGVWIYHDKKIVNQIKWTDKRPPSEMFEYDSKGNLVLLDITYYGCFHTYRNGSHRMSAKPL